MKNFTISLIAIALLFMIACKAEIDKELIHGQWKASAFIENGTAADVDLTNVSFTFNKDGSYQYHGTLQPQESGRFYVLGRMLFTTDTTANQRIEKSVKITQLTTDSLYFQMNAGGVPQGFQLYKVSTK